MSWDPYLDLEHGVLRNRLGITDRRELAQVEADLTAARLYELQLAPIVGAYDLAHLQAIHRHLFQDVYDWAGQLRTVSLGKGRLFCPPSDIETVANRIFDRLAHADHLVGLQRAVFVDRLAELLGHVNELHPFREGNGRTQRAFLFQLSYHAGYWIRWENMDPAVNDEASWAARNGDHRQLADMLDHLVEPLPRRDEGHRFPQPRGPQA